jgi:hypothetical protein
MADRAARVEYVEAPPITLIIETLERGTEKWRAQTRSSLRHWRRWDSAGPGPRGTDADALIVWPSAHGLCRQ